MAARNNELPEGTDHIVNGAMERGTAEGSGGSGGFVATGGEGDTGGTLSHFKGQIRDGAASLKSQASDKAREFAVDGKGRASDTLDDLSRILTEAAASIDDKIGAEYGDYARKAASAVSDFSTSMRGKDVDELLDDARDAIRKSPAVAIGVAATVGFALVRIVKAGLEDDTRKTGSAKTKTKTGA